MARVCLFRRGNKRKAESDEAAVPLLKSVPSVTDWL